MARQQAQKYWADKILPEKQEQQMNNAMPGLMVIRSQMSQLHGLDLMTFRRWEIRETGGVAALPMWIEFMRTALKDTPETPLEVPEGIVKAFINPETGLLTPETNKAGIWEFFQAELAPTSFAPPSDKSTTDYDQSDEKAD